MPDGPELNDAAKVRRLESLVLDMFEQGCLEHVGIGERTYHHRFISCYEEAQEYLLSAGLIDPHQCSVGVSL